MILVEYDPHWKIEFEALKRIYEAVLDADIMTIEHVGSTSIEGLAAKPILDIDIVIADEAAFSPVKNKLESVGYWHNGNQGIPTREVFKRVDEYVPHFGNRRAWMLHHLYVCPADSPELKRHIAFRDYLRAHPEAKSQYEAIKREIASRSHGDRKLYAKIKEQEGVCTQFVEMILEKHSRSNHDDEQL